MSKRSQQISDEMADVPMHTFANNTHFDQLGRGHGKDYDSLIVEMGGQPIGVVRAMRELAVVARDTLANAGFEYIEPPKKQRKPKCDCQAINIFGHRSYCELSPEYHNLDTLPRSKVQREMDAEVAAMLAKLSLAPAVGWLARFLNSELDGTGYAEQVERTKVGK